MPLHERARPGADRPGNYLNERALGGDRLNAILPQEAGIQPLVDLVSELHPNLPPSIAESLVREALDGCADAVLDAEWARIRAAMPGYVHPRRGATAHAERRLRQLADAQPRPGDYLGDPARDRWVT